MVKLRTPARCSNVFRNRLLPNKALGQHFLIDDTISQRIVSALSPLGKNQVLVEIGPGTGALTQFLAPFYGSCLHLVEVDARLIPKLKKYYPEAHLHHADALSLNWTRFFPRSKVTIIGNLPYNVASPLFFQFVAARTHIWEVVCMVQHEVAQRLSASPGSKTYGIPSVWVQAFYQVEYLFTVPPQAFSPPPKVQSGVIRLRRNACDNLPCDEALFLHIVKTAFQQRRKTLRNALHAHLPTSSFEEPWWGLRAEQLSVADWISLVSSLASSGLG